MKSVNILRHVLHAFGASDQLTVCENIVTGIALSVLALICVSFIASLLVFIHWSVTTMEILLLIYIGFEIKIYLLLKKNHVKLVKMFDQIEQMYGKPNKKIDLSSWYFLTSTFLVVFIHVFFYVRTHNDLINNILSAGKILPLFYVNCIITNLFVSALFMFSMFVCFQIRSTFFNIYIEKFNQGNFQNISTLDSRIALEKFHNFYTTFKFSFISYIEPLEKLNSMCLVFSNLYLIFVVFIIYSFNGNIIEILMMTLSIFIFNSFHISNYFIMKRKRKLTKFISNCIISLRMSMKNTTCTAIKKQGFVELYTQQLKEKNMNTKNLRTVKAETT